MDHRIVFFPEGTPPAKRRRRLFFITVWLGVAAMVTWPLFAPFAGAEPLILGLPLSLAWIILAVLTIFFALLVLHMAEENAEADEARGSAGPANAEGSEG